MRIAIFHDLPSGGAKRALYQFVQSLRLRHVIDAYTLSTADETFLDIRPLVQNYYSYPWSGSAQRFPRLRRFSVAAMALDAERLFVELRGVYRKVAADIDARGYDLAFVHHGATTKSPWLLRHLLTPSVYSCAEPRRESFEYRFKPGSGRMPLRRAARIAIFESPLTRMDILSARAATVVAVNSLSTLEAVKRAYGIEPKVCYLGVDGRRFLDLGLPRVNEVLSVGGLHPYKGHDLVLSAVGLIPKGQRPRVRIAADRAIIGYADELRAAARRLGIDLTIDIRLSEAQLVEAYNRARLTICAAHLEPFGLTSLESMACGTPVVAVNEGGFRETVHEGTNGLLVEYSAEALATGIRQGMEPRVWEHLSKGASESAKLWTWEASVSRLEYLFDHARAVDSRTLGPGGRP